jgi:hypothetical protein
VLLHHGITLSSDGFVLYGPTESLAFRLTDEGGLHKTVVNRTLSDAVLLPIVRLTSAVDRLSFRTSSRMQPGSQLNCCLFYSLLQLLQSPATQNGGSSTAGRTVFTGMAANFGNTALCLQREPGGVGVALPCSEAMRVHDCFLDL